MRKEGVMDEDAIFRCTKSEQGPADCATRSSHASCQAKDRPSSYQQQERLVRRLREVNRDYGKILDELEKDNPCGGAVSRELLELELGALGRDRISIQEKLSRWPCGAREGAEIENEREGVLSHPVTFVDCWQANPYSMRPPPLDSAGVAEVPANRHFMRALR